MRLVIFFLCLMLVAMPVSALEIQAPSVPASAEQWMPNDTSSFPDGLLEMIEKSLDSVYPELRVAACVCLGIVATVLLISILEAISVGTKLAVQISGSAAVSMLLMQNTHSMIRMASSLVQEIIEYGRLLLPVMTTALAAQGGISKSAAIYAGSAFFISVLNSTLNTVLLPGVYLYLLLHIGNSTTGEDFLKRTGEILKGFLKWSLKSIIILFTTYLGVTGVISGATDAAALKVTKVTIASVVPVVGSALANASEAVLVSAGLLKTAAGVYGIFAVLAIFLNPFLKIGVYYLTLKLTAAVCTVFGEGNLIGLIQAFCSALGFILAMTATACVMVLVSTYCFMKGVG